MSRSFSEAPFFKVGDEVVCIEDGDINGTVRWLPFWEIKKGESYIVEEINISPYTGKYYCWLKGLKRANICDIGPIYGYACSRFTPIQRNKRQVSIAEEVFSEYVEVREVLEPIKEKVK